MQIELGIVKPTEAWQQRVLKEMRSVTKTELMLDIARSINNADVIDEKIFNAAVNKIEAFQKLDLKLDELYNG